MLETEIKNPYTKSELLYSLKDITQKVETYYNSLAPQIFFNDNLGGWSPAQNLSHITFIAAIAATLFKLPRFLLIPLGKPSNGKDFITTKNIYIGAEKPIYIGPLAPMEIQLPPQPGLVVQKMISEWRAKNFELYEVLEQIPEKDFDEYTTPHPSLGLISLREMIYVLIIHPIHHTYKVQKKVANLV